MTQKYSAASIYGNIDRMDAVEIQNWLNWHKRLKYPSRFITLFTAAKFEQGPNVLRQVKDALPNTTPIWRGYDGKDAYGNAANPEWTDANFFLRLTSAGTMSPQRAAELWFERRVKPYLNIIRDSGAIIHLLNEANAIFNAPFETACIRILGEEGIRAGAFAWTAGTPDWQDYQAQVIADEVAMADQYCALVMTHEYAGIKAEEQNSLINRNQMLVKLFPKPPDVFLGEFALCKATIINSQIHLDASIGWREMGVSETQYFDFISSTANLWYLRNKVFFSLFDWAGWGLDDSFGVRKSSGLLDELVEASEWMTITVEESPVPTPSPAPIEIVTKPPEAQIGVRAKIKSIPAEYRNLRVKPMYNAAKSGELHEGDVVKRYEIPAYKGPVSAVSDGLWIYVEKLDGDTVAASGWVWRDRIVWEPISGTQEIPLPQPSPIETGEGETQPPANTRKEYTLVIEATDAQHQKVEQALMTVLVGMINFGKAMEMGMKVEIHSETVA